MRRIGDLLKEMGFNPEAPTSTNKAFFKHLVRAAELASPPSTEVKTTLPQPGQQLSFDLEVLGLAPSESKTKKAY